jgi:hypothetical protein
LEAVEGREILKRFQVSAFQDGLRFRISGKEEVLDVRKNEDENETSRK